MTCPLSLALICMALSSPGDSGDDAAGSVHFRALGALLDGTSNEVLRERVEESFRVRRQSAVPRYLDRKLAAAARERSRWVLVESLRAEDASHRFVLAVWKPGGKTLRLATNRTTKGFRRRHAQLYRSGSRDRFVFEFELPLDTEMKELERRLAAKSPPKGVGGDTSVLGGTTRTLASGGFPVGSLAVLHGSRFSVETRRATAPEGPEKPAYLLIESVYVLWRRGLGATGDPAARIELTKPSKGP